MSKNYLAAPKIVSSFTAGSREKDTIFGAARNFFDPSYFVTALGTVLSAPFLQVLLTYGFFETDMDSS